jgi:hypothetical protein
MKITNLSSRKIPTLQNVTKWGNASSNNTKGSTTT